MSREKVRARARHPLLLYRRLAGYWRIPLTLLLSVSAGLLIWNHPELQELRLTLVLTFLLSSVLLVLTSIMTRVAYAKCGEDGLFIQLPLYQLHVPYESVVETRAAFMYELFPPFKQPLSTRGFLDPLWKKSAVVVRLRSWPRPRRQLRLWMDSRMMIHDGLVLLVKDHMNFRREIQEAMIHWRAGRGNSQRGPSEMG
jgi:hypothetical protein